MNISIIIPTRNRPIQIMQCLNHLSNQTLLPDEVLIVSSGDSIKHIINKFKDKLNINYIQSELSGQIHQRNLGKENLNRKSDFVLFLDDDVLLEASAIQKIMQFWDTKDNKTAGIGFNLIYPNNNSKPFLFKIYKLLYKPKPGSITKSGMPINYSNLSSNIKTQYLCGGATVWRRKIIEKYNQKTINTKWAQGEDLRFSYPISKKYKLYVYADARAKEIEFENENISSSYMRGRTQGLTDIYFTLLYKEFSTFLCLCILTIKSIINIFSLKNIMHGTGQIVALVSYFKSKILLKDFSNLINN